MDHSVFYRIKDGAWSILTMHMDDITGICSSDSELDSVKKAIGAFWKYKEKDTNKPVKILGLLVSKTSDHSIFLSQPDFI